MGLKTILSHISLLSESTARVSLRKYFIPGRVGRGLDLDLRIRPAPAPAASGNPSGWAQAGPKWVDPRGWAQAGPTWVGPSRAQVGGPKAGPSGWAQAGPKWVGPGYTDLAPLGLRSKNKVFKLSG